MRNCTPLVILSLSQPQKQDSYFYNNYCREQGHRFISFCLKQVQSLSDSAGHPHSKFKSLPPMFRCSKNRALVWYKLRGGWSILKFHLIPGWRGEQYSGYISDTVLCKESVSHGWGYEEGLRYLQVTPAIRNLKKHHCIPHHYLATVVYSTYLFVLDPWVRKRHVEQSFLSKKRTSWRGARANWKFPPQSADWNILTC